MVLPHLARLTEESRRQRAAVGLAHPEGSDFNFARHVLGAQLPVMPKPAKDLPFGRYDPNFIYQYVKAPNVTVAQMRELSRHYSREAITWLERYPGLPMP